MYKKEKKMNLETRLLMPSPSKHKQKKYFDMCLNKISRLKCIDCEPLKSLSIAITAFIFFAWIICTILIVIIMVSHYFHFHASAKDIELILSIADMPKHIFSTTKTANSLSLYPCDDTNWLYTEYDNVKMRQYLSTKYSNDSYQIDESLKYIVEEADFWRYSIIHEFGGLYMDSDTKCAHSVDEWLKAFDLFTINAQKKSKYILNNLLTQTKIPFGEIIEYPKNNKIEIDVVIGIEFYDFMGNGLQFVQWAFMSQPKSKILQSVIDTVLNNLENIKDTKENIISRTGPGAFTNGLLTFIREHSLYNDNVSLFDYQQIDASGQLIPMKCDDQILWILILPYRAFGYSQAHREHKDGTIRADESQKLIVHNFEGSWRK